MTWCEIAVHIARALSCLAAIAITVGIAYRALQTE
jgi:hypothetical protein